jgi:outer membrane protein OmpA-like peptidoglycan-associated protein
MRRARFFTLFAIAGCLLAMTAAADENDFVGYQFSQSTGRDYDRGFFIGAEAWATNPRNLHFEPAISSAGSPAPTGGVLLDVDFDLEVSPRFFVGYQANRRIGRFTLSYWDFSEDASRLAEGSAGIIVETGTHPARGKVTRTAFHARADVDMEYAELQWRKDFGQGRKFSGYWTVSAHAFESEHQTESLFWNHISDPTASDAVRVADFTAADGYGGKVGLGGRYWFNDRFSLGGYAAVGFFSTEQDYTYVDQNVGTGSTFAFLTRDDTELTNVLLEGSLDLNIRLGAGFDLGLGYRYLDFDDIVAEDRFVDDTGSFVAVEQQHGLAFDGPYLNLSWISGVSKIDSDGDGVLDVYDDCPDTPAGAWVDEKGCPRDLDEDGVYDGIDRCPGTQFGTRVDEWGCGVDSDGDGVADGLDLCPNTPGCALVDGRGCPKDSDGDGVANGCDACPGTEAGAAVDARGCKVDLDSDGDTVPDSMDRCPNTARGAMVDEYGCAELVSMTINFVSNSADLGADDRAQLSRVAMALMNDGGSFEVQGHTDSQNTVEYNQALSEQRAGAVRDFLVAQGVSSGNLTAVGYSELKPIADNATAEGRAANRRVEIVRR